MKDIRVVNTEFGNLKKYEDIVKFKHRPDGLLLGKVITDSGRVDDHLSALVIETELSLKSQKRYRQIWREYVYLLKKGRVYAFLYIMKDEAALKRIETLFKKEKFDLPIKDRKELEEIERRFCFTTLTP